MLMVKMNREDIDFQERQCVVFGNQTVIGYNGY